MKKYMIYNKIDKRLINNLCIITSLILLIFSLFMIGKTYYGLEKEKIYFKKLAFTVAEKEHLSECFKPTDEKIFYKEQDAKYMKYQELVEQNNDFFGWIKIEDTTLDYPVMYSPNEPDFYLCHDFSKNSSISGVPFVDVECKDNNGIYIIYGHNMRNGTMFNTILKYKDFEFWKQHKKIVFNTLKEDKVFEVVSAFYSQVYTKDQKDVFRFYDYKDLSEEKTFCEFVSNVQKKSLYDTGITPTYGEEVLLLVTCSYHTNEGRFVVVARHAE